MPPKTKAAISSVTSKTLMDLSCPNTGPNVQNAPSTAPTRKHPTVPAGEIESRFLSSSLADGIGVGSVVGVSASGTRERQVRIVTRANRVCALGSARLAIICPAIVATLATII